jgi:hypothetical protein
MSEWGVFLSLVVQGSDRHARRLSSSVSLWLITYWINCCQKLAASSGGNVWLGQALNKPPRNGINSRWMVLGGRFLLFSWLKAAHVQHL